MQIKTILRLLGLLLMMFSVSMLTPLLINFIFHEQFWLPFVAAFFVHLLRVPSFGSALKKNIKNLKFEMVFYSRYFFGLFFVCMLPCLLFCY